MYDGGTEFKISISKDLKVFESLEEYTNEYSSSSDVHLDNYSRVFICYFSILIFTLIVFIFHHIFKFIKKKLVDSELFHSFIRNQLNKAKIKLHKIKKHRPIH